MALTYRSNRILNFAHGDMGTTPVVLVFLLRTVCGRIKDVIIVGGRNVFPEDVEKAVAAVDGVRAGNVIAFGVEGRRGKEGLIVVAESKTDDTEGCRRTVAERP